MRCSFAKNRSIAFSQFQQFFSIFTIKKISKPFQTGSRPTSCSRSWAWPCLPSSWPRSRWPSRTTTTRPPSRAARTDCTRPLLRRRPSHLRRLPKHRHRRQPLLRRRQQQLLRSRQQPMRIRQPVENVDLRKGNHGDKWVELDWSFHSSFQFSSFIR